MLEELVIIDSDTEILDAFKAFLERHQYSVVKASNGEEALLQIQFRKPDLIVIEPALLESWPENDLKQFIRYSTDIPVIALSKRNSCSLVFPFSDYLLKPISLARLLKAIRNALHRRDDSSALSC